MMFVGSLRNRCRGQKQQENDCTDQFHHDIHLSFAVTRQTLRAKNLTHLICVKLYAVKPLRRPRKPALQAQAA
jgi:hypothetical protein